MAEEDGAQTTLLGHLIELRTRLLRIVGVVLLGFLVCAPFASELFAVVAQPLIDKLPDGTSMIATEVASSFLTPFKLAMFVAVFITMPFTLFQIWGFVAPGLYRHEKRLVVPLLASSIVLFYLGAMFAYFVVFPLMFAFFAAAAPEGVTMMTDISHYMSFVLTLFFAFGMAFEVPIATVLMVWVGITTPEALTKKRAYVLLGAFVGGMLLTPPDIISQTLLAVPVYLLFELGIVMARIVVPRKTKEIESA